jgi:hypothetical protein
VTRHRPQALLVPDPDVAALRSSAHSTPVQRERVINTVFLPIIELQLPSLSGAPDSSLLTWSLFFCPHTRQKALSDLAQSDQCQAQPLLFSSERTEKSAWHTGRQSRARPDWSSHSRPAPAACENRARRRTRDREAQHLIQQHQQLHPQRVRAVRRPGLVRQQRIGHRLRPVRPPDAAGGWASFSLIPSMSACLCVCDSLSVLLCCGQKFRNRHGETDAELLTAAAARAATRTPSRSDLKPSRLSRTRKVGKIFGRTDCQRSSPGPQLDDSAPRGGRSAATMEH